MNVSRETVHLGQVVRPGATWRQPLNVTFAVVVRCERAEPASFSGSVVLGNRELFRTDPHASYDGALRAAEERFGQTFSRLFA